MPPPQRTAPNHRRDAGVPRLTPADTAESFALAACGLLRLDARGVITLANGVIAAWTNTPNAESLKGKRFQDILTVGSKLFWQTHCWPLIEMQGSIAEVQLDVVQAGDAPSLPALVNAVRRADKTLDIAMFVVRDRRKYERELIEARRRAEELLAALQQREKELRALTESSLETLREQEREARQRAVLAEQLVGIVSHDIRNPLNAIFIGAQLLARADLGPHASTAKRIMTSATRATRLTSELLDFTQARLGGGLRVTLAPIALHSVVADAVEEVRLACGRSIEHRRVGEGDATGDPDRIAQVVTNLVNNALAYGTREATVMVTSAIAADTIEIRVHNDGKPIPAELQAAIFEPLRRGDEQVQRGSRSVGLGLYIVREIAHAHGGEARVESSEAAGTTFIVTLPRSRAIADGR